MSQSKVKGQSIVEKTYLEDYGIGERFVSPARTITESDIHSFAALTGDWHPIHTDVEYAKNTPFGERIAHGMLTLAIGGALIHRVGPHVYSPKGFIAFYGMDNVRFVAPLRIGDTIHCELTVKGLEPKDDKKGVLVYETIIINQRDEVLLTLIQKLLVTRAPKD